jgi:hypothetical protein
MQSLVATRSKLLDRRRHALGREVRLPITGPAGRRRSTGGSTPLSVAGPCGTATRRVDRARGSELAFVGRVTHGSQTDQHWAARRPVASEPSHIPSDAALSALQLSEIARGIRGLDVLRRSVDRAPPSCT